MQLRLAEFVNHLKAYPTATEALNHWCSMHLKRQGEAVIARVLADDEADQSAYRGRLSIIDGERLRYRKVQLVWGGIVLSEAENWYLPDRIPRAMRSKLLSGTLPFGEIVRSLKPKRTIIAMYSQADLARGGVGPEQCIRRLEETASFSSLDNFILHIRAVMTAATGGIIADVREHYRLELLA